MGNYIWIFERSEDRHLLWTFACSLALHFVLFAILVIKPFFPITGSFDKLDSIWLYPAMTVEGNSATSAGVTPRVEGQRHHEPVKVAERVNAVQPVAEKQEAVAEENEGNDAVPDKPASDAEKPAEPVTELVTVKKISIKPEKPVVKEKMEKKQVPAAPPERLPDEHSGTPVNQRKLPQVAATGEKEPVKKTEALKTENSGDGKNAGKTTAGADRAKIPASSEKAVIRSAAVSRAIQNAATSAGGPAVTAGRNKYADVRQILGRNPVVAELPFLRPGKGGADKNGANPGSQAGSGPSQAGGTGLPDGKDGGKKAPSVAAPSKPKSEENGKDRGGEQKKGTGSAPGDAGIPLLPLTGDLKLEASGNTGFVISVSFKEYLKSHRNRPMTRAEAKRVQVVKPATRTTGKTVEAVVGTAGEGVYEFTVTPVVGDPVTAVFKVRIFEGRNNARTRILGKKTVNGKTMVARILMPEGIFWDDDSYFSGNLEDSDSITKYNSDTGLTWKEYKSSED